MSQPETSVANGPRIIFVPAADVATPSGAPQGWRPTGGGGSAPRFGWRLIGANNRELGRSPSTYGGLRAARDQAAFVRDNATALKEQLDNDPVDGSWGWRASLDGTVIATSGRRYQRHRECSYNFQQFVLGLGGAVENLSPVNTSRVRRYASATRSRLETGTPFEPAAPQ